MRGEAPKSSLAPCPPPLEPNIMTVFERMVLALLSKIAGNTTARLVTDRQRKKADQEFEILLANVISIDRASPKKPEAEEEKRILMP